MLFVLKRNVNYWSNSYAGVNIEPSQSRISITEGDHGARSDSGIVQAIGCIELTRGNLQRTVTVSVVTSSLPTSTGTKICKNI